jgi:class 3 adenylate cyclase
MWYATVRSSDREPKEHQLRVGKMVIGRMNDCEIIVDDVSASRRHAELNLNPAKDLVTVTDLNSTNGTFVNRQRVIGPHPLQNNDSIRIGQVTITITRVETGPQKAQGISGSHRFTRELLLESLDQNAVLLYEVARQLNTVTDINTALTEVGALIKRAMGADRCEVVLAKHFPQLNEMGWPACLVDDAIKNQSAVVIADLAEKLGADAINNPELFQIKSAMCVPVIGGSDLLALLCVYRSKKNPRAFDQRDMQLAVGIGHQAALTIQRMYLLEKVGREQQVHQLLLRFLSPQEAEFILQDYLTSGTLPGLAEQKVSILFADIADSTALAERLGTQPFATILNRFYEDATDLAFANGGMIKYMGDGVMAVFVQTETAPDHEERAVRTGVSLLSKVKTTGHLDARQRIIMGVSVNTGTAMVGYVGTHERAEFTVLGDTVNVAYRMQDFARPYRLVIGPATIAAVIGKYQTQRLGNVLVRGRERPIQLYEVLY